MARITLTDARRIMLRGRPWTFRLECTLNGSSKFWLATGRGRHEVVEVHFGAIGNKGTVRVKDWDYVEKTAPEKEAKGYVYVDTPFVRVRTVGVPPVAVVTTPSPVPPATPAVVIQPPVVMPIATPLVLPPGPWGKIVQVKQQASGQWVGLSPTGGVVMFLTRDGARTLMQDYLHIGIGGL